MELRDTFVGIANGTRFYRERATESYVEIPPALIITDERGDVWTLGVRYNGFMEFSVLRNDVPTGDFASRIVYQAGKVRIFGRAGSRTWSGRSFI